MMRLEEFKKSGNPSKKRSWTREVVLKVFWFCFFLFFFFFFFEEAVKEFPRRPMKSNLEAQHGEVDRCRKSSSGSHCYG